MANSFLLLLETILFSVDLDEPESELEKHSLAYLIFKWYQAHYLYNVLTNPNYQKEELFGGRYWIVHHIKESIPRLEQYIKKIGKLIYKKAKPIFLDWAEEHDIEHFEHMMDARVEDVRRQWLSLEFFIDRVALSKPSDYSDFANFLEAAFLSEGRVPPFDKIPQTKEVILNKIKELFQNHKFKKHLNDYLEELEYDLYDAKNEEDELEIDRISEEINYIKKVLEIIDKPKNQWTKHDIDTVNDILLPFGHNLYPTILEYNKEDSTSQETIVWLYMVYHLRIYFDYKGHDEIFQWIDKVKKIRELFKYDQPPNNLKELVIHIEKIINFTHNNGHLLADHIDEYDEDLSVEEYDKINQIIEEDIYDLLDLLNYFAGNKYKDPELVKTLKQYKYYHVPKKKENKLK